MEAYNPQSEYDAFGPWIYELQGREQLPPPFSSHYTERDDCLMLIKIPREIERRNVAAGMNLYDTILGLYDEHIYLMRRTENSVTEARIPYREINMIEDFVDLLHGKLKLFTTDQNVEIPYSAVSQDIIVKAVMIMRSKYAQRSETLAAQESALSASTEVRYQNLLYSMMSHGDCFNLSVAQPSITAKSANRHVTARLMRAIFRKTLLPSHHLANARELLIISRGRPFKQPWSAYSYALNYIPLEKIRDIGLANDTDTSNLQKLDILLDNHTQTYYLDTGNVSAQEYYHTIQSRVNNARAAAPH